LALLVRAAGMSLWTLEERESPVQKASISEHLRVCPEDNDDAKLQ
jgi:hypothetical protein